MRQYTTTWNGTMTQARALVAAWKKEQAEKKRMHKMMAEKYLLENGFEIVGWGDGKQVDFIITDTFKTI